MGVMKMKFVGDVRAGEVRLSGTGVTTLIEIELVAFNPLLSVAMADTV